MKTLALTLLCYVLTASLAGAARLRVPRDFSSIQSAVNAALQDDVVEISNGVYSETILVTGKLGVTLRARRGSRVIIDAGGAGVGLRVMASTGIVLKNLVVRNASVDGFVISADGTRMEGCRARDIGDNGIYLEADDCYITRCRASGCGRSGIHVLGDLNTLEDNRVEQSDRYGIMLGTGAIAVSDCLLMGNRVLGAHWDAIAIAPSSRRCTLLGNTIQRTGLDSGIIVGGTDHVIESNRIVRTGAEGIICEGTGILISRNRIRRTGSIGVQLTDEALDGTLCGNIIQRSATLGVSVEASARGNLLSCNRVKKSGEYDLYDHSIAGDNTFSGNRFGTIAP
ncbi:MAG: right-handed parallel beta-helix repeat-containing protein [Planctomycetota bacterium]